MLHSAGLSLKFLKLICSNFHYSQPLGSHCIVVVLQGMLGVTAGHHRDTHTHAHHFQLHIFGLQV